jgi:flavin-dependent dehydrogenase
MPINRCELCAGAMYLPPAEAQGLICDVAVIGGSFSGCAAALPADRNGTQVVMSEECPWIAGQVMSQAVSPEDYPRMEQFVSTPARSGIRRNC